MSRCYTLNDSMDMNLDPDTAMKTLLNLCEPILPGQAEPEADNFLSSVRSLFARFNKCSTHADYSKLLNEMSALRPLFAQTRKTHAFDAIWIRLLETTSQYRVSPKA
ncbi:hypothetical protein AVEN_36124-1 [Araneus ventricosus]|uniref:Uncharacterized protein n=1 Tax=Araneus ventricosus TaxID=182803 RepID=A0A4Y2T6F1_ARAVE|nr:hypothetical protein AVEN_36124-1 [Araneus ventricosus]